MEKYNDYLLDGVKTKQPKEQLLHNLQALFRLE